MWVTHFGNGQTDFRKLQSWKEKPLTIPGMLWPWSFHWDGRKSVFSCNDPTTDYCIFLSKNSNSGTRPTKTSAWAIYLFVYLKGEIRDKCFYYSSNRICLVAMGNSSKVNWILLGKQTPDNQKTKIVCYEKWKSQ